jgi:hypothetical protein
MQALPHHGAKKRLVKIRLQKADSQQGPASDHGLQWLPLVLSAPASLQQFSQQHLAPSPLPVSHVQRPRRAWHYQRVLRFLRSLILFGLIAVIGIGASGPMTRASHLQAQRSSCRNAVISQFLQRLKGVMQVCKPLPPEADLWLNDHSVPS